MKVVAGVASNEDIEKVVKGLDAGLSSHLPAEAKARIMSRVSAKAAIGA